MCCGLLMIVMVLSRHMVLLFLILAQYTHSMAPPVGYIVAFQRNNAERQQSFYFITFYSCFTYRQFSFPTNLCVGGIAAAFPVIHFTQEKICSFLLLFFFNLSSFRMDMKKHRHSLVLRDAGQY